jgi:K+-sensing histidine kinase KdpD
MALWWTWMVMAGGVLGGLISEIAERAQIRRTQAEVAAREEKRRLDHEQRLRRQLQSIDAHRVDFLRALAHDFKTPIASLDALTEALGWDEHPLSEEQRAEVVDLIQTHTRHLSRLLGEVRDVANASSFGPEARLEIADVFLPELIRSAVATSGLGPGRVVTTIAPDVQLIRTDSRKLSRVLTNLLENAGRHAPASEPVEVTVRRPPGVAEVVEISVLDRGPGIPPELTAQVFEKFASFGDQRSSGLGMWIVSEFVSALGGGINLENRDGGGLAVRVVLPAESSVTPAAPVFEQAEYP